MDPVQKAVWFIESHYRDDISLAVVAEAVSVSRFHLTRAFGVCTGHSVNGYIRARRLSEAARRLASERACVLDVGLGVGYGSHEAFTRAFRHRFGRTPAEVRAARSLESLTLMEPIKMTDDHLADPPEPRIVSGDSLLIVGLKRRYGERSIAAIPSQWQDFTPHVGHVPHQDGAATFGVVCNSDEAGNIDYLTGVAVTEIADVPPGLDGLRIAPQTYAVFEHVGHVSDIRRTWAGIFGKWLPASGRRLVDAPQFERYGEAFDPHTGDGRLEIWIPVA